MLILQFDQELGLDNVHQVLKFKTIGPESRFELKPYTSEQIITRLIFCLNKLICMKVNLIVSSNKDHLLSK